MPALLPTNKPAPMIPPIEIMVTWRERRLRLRPALKVSARSTIRFR
jgi:hypothetical protein